MIESRAKWWVVIVCLLSTQLVIYYLLLFLFPDISNGIWGAKPVLMASFLINIPFIQVFISYEIIVGKEQIVKSCWILFKKYEFRFNWNDLIIVEYYHPPAFFYHNGLLLLIRNPLRAIKLTFRKNRQERFKSWHKQNIIIGIMTTNTYKVIQFIADNKPSVEIDEKILKRYSING